MSSVQWYQGRNQSQFYFLFQMNWQLKGAFDQEPDVVPHDPETKSVVIPFGASSSNVDGIKSHVEYAILLAD